ncbi:hypothetical protein QQS21_005116 [Conoideocrella luteorostrata]|uniref:Eukaryotic integral membrane protein n=1 Tax=Conoideocrella luteorostrata TaxID=1105319 RepID=A0AAJ0CSV3_9HYPO|nr:hypothetical protein QQS21_005116 [Conoideocrella luteorostrata]
MPPRINIPPITRAILIVLLFQSLLSAAIRYRQWTEHSHIVIPYLTLVPQLSLLYPWTFLTSALVESNIFTLAISGLTLYHGGRYLERAWSSADLAKFLALVTLVPNVLTFLVMIFFFTLTRNESWTLTNIAGGVSIQVAFLVAFSQLIPAHTVTLFRGILSLKVPRLPILYIGIVTVLSLTPLLSRAAVWQAMFGFLVSWTYLRFYKTVFPDLDSSQPTSLRGDASETFAFAEFFPGPVKPFVGALSDKIFEILVAIRLCTPFSHADMARGDRALQRGTPGTARAEAERRRAIALKALDQRLSAASAGPASRGPPPVQPSGPTVQTQPQLNTHTAMASKPGDVLGETKFEPDHDDGKN